MTRSVFCRKYQKDMPGLEKPPFPGPKGEDIYEHVSAEAWKAWTSHQTMLINEKKLSMMEPESRKFLQEQQDKFFSGEDFEAVEGYIPPEK